VRELRNVIQRAELLAIGNRIDVADLNLPRAPAAPRGTGTTVDPDRQRIETALASNHGIIAQAAAELGLSRQALYRRMDRFGIPRE
jgi:transcriptional regulator of acetoin/glycerol metabolism